MAKAEEKGVEFLLPSDVVLADNFAPDANTQTVSIDSIPDGWMGLDIGPESLKSFQGALSDCKTVVWNGPMGVFEFDAFAAGTVGIADTLAELSGKGCCTIIGGGDSVAAVEKAGVAEKMSHISTGGGSSLEWPPSTRASSRPRQLVESRCRPRPPIPDFAAVEPRSSTSTKPN